MTGTDTVSHKQCPGGGWGERDRGDGETCRWGQRNAHGGTEKHTIFQIPTEKTNPLTGHTLTN